jgi:hypothetical protein
MNLLFGAALGLVRPRIHEYLTRSRSVVGRPPHAVAFISSATA